MLFVQTDHALFYNNQLTDKPEYKNPGKQHPIDTQKSQTYQQPEKNQLAQRKQTQDYFMAGSVKATSREVPFLLPEP